jgi:LAO/AO transport system kinase
LDPEKSALRVRPGSGASHPSTDLIADLAKPRRLSRQQLVDGILRGDRSILAQAITLVESSRAADQEIAEQILEDCLPHTGQSIRLGITGVPGAGKSSLIEALGMSLIRDRNERVAVLAIDPSSQLSGGSILGDKTRMRALSASDMAFIRPSPSSTSLGGVARRTREAMLLCEAAGYRNVIVETVGVGQSETAVHDMVDFFVLIALTGAGDDLQGIKRGVMELADVVVINKADGENLPAAQLARSEAQNALHFFPVSASGWIPQAITCSAQTCEGLTELWNCLLRYIALTRANGYFAEVRRSQSIKWMEETVQQELTRRFQSDPAVRQRLQELQRELMRGQTSSFRAARILLDAYFRKTEWKP